MQKCSKLWFQDVLYGINAENIRSRSGSDDREPTACESTAFTVTAYYQMYEKLIDGIVDIYKRFRTQSQRF